MTNKLTDGLQLADQTKTTKSADFVPAPVGLTVGRFVEYIELGLQPNRPYKGQAKDPTRQVRLVFELLSPAKNIREVEFDGVKKTVADRVAVTCGIASGEKSKFQKLFSKMRVGHPEVQHMAQLLGEAFLITIRHEAYKDAAGNDKIAVKMDTDSGDFQIQEAVQTDAISGVRTPVNVPAAVSPLKLFLFDQPTKAHWDSLFVDGSRTVKDDKGQDTQVSNNWMQEKIRAALNFSGSSLELLLTGDALETLEDLIAEPEAEEPLTAGEAALKAAKPVKKATKAKAVSADDALADLGLA